MANSGVKGKVVFAGTTNGIPGLEVLVVDFDPMYEEQILNPNSNPVLTKADGSFEIHYSTDAYRRWDDEVPQAAPDLVVRVYVPGGRLVYESKEFTNVKVAMLEMDPIAIDQRNVEGWLVTCATLDPTNGDPVWLTSGNKIETLIDGAKVFPEVTKLAKGAKASINFMNYKFYIASNVVTLYPDPFVQPKDGDSVVGEQLQQILFDQSSRIPVNILVWDFDVEGLAALILGVLTSGVSSLVALLLSASLLGVVFTLFFGALAGIFGGLGVIDIFNLAGKGGDTASDVEKYFRPSQAETAAFKSLWSILHARVVVIDGVTGIVMGSSITRGYFSDNEHLIHDARHGGSLTHDVSVKITGPAVEHLDRSLATIWNESSASTLTPTVGQAAATAPDVAAVQVIRTLPGDTFKQEHTWVSGAPPSVPKLTKGKLGIPAGETAILEAYQRGIAQAENYIYIEDQYFTCPEIVNALIHRMNTISDLQLIMVLNVQPDHPDYRQKQIDCIKQLRTITNNQRVKVYTLWSCAEAKPKMDIMPIEVHSKVGIIDDKWATVGTANLDTASMNQISTVTTEDIDLSRSLKNWPTWKKVLLFPVYLTGRALISSALALGGHYAFRRPTQHANPNYSEHPSRFCDLNLVIYNGVAGQVNSDFVSSFRKELWAEHLGLQPTDTSLNNPGAPGAGWATKLWMDQEDAKFKATQNQKRHPAKILAWQPELDTKKYLAARGLKPADFCVRKTADVFDVEKKEWKRLKLSDKCE